MKKIVVFVLTALLFAVMLVPCFAQDSVRLIDNAGLLTEEEYNTVAVMLDEISERLSCDVVILTEPYIDSDAESYADDYFDYNGYGYGDEGDGVLLLVSMDPREWHVSGSGICNSRYISDSALEYISENISDDLQNENYVECFNTYAKRCDEVISDARQGKAYKKPFAFGVSLAVSVVVGFVAAFIVTGIMKSKLKSVASRSRASDYLKTGSLNVTEARDIFLYRQVTRTEKQSSSSSHTSSSGKSHSGVGGSF